MGRQGAGQRGHPLSPLGSIDHPPLKNWSAHDGSGLGSEHAYMRFWPADRKWEGGGLLGSRHLQLAAELCSLWSRVTLAEPPNSLISLSPG